jgi:thioredoxin 1
MRLSCSPRRMHRCGRYPRCQRSWLSGSRFSPGAFFAAQDAGKAILVDISAPWCPVCRAQKPILEELTAKPEFKELVVFNVDLDTQKQNLRGFKARSQSTLITFKGPTETGHSVRRYQPELDRDLAEERATGRPSRAGAADGGWQGRKGAAWRIPGRHRSHGRNRHRQETGDAAGRRVARLAHTLDDCVLRRWHIS